MPLTATSLGHWMKQHSPGELTVTTGRAPLRGHHNPPHGCTGRFYREYAFRYGWRSPIVLPDGSEESGLGVGLVTDGSAMFAFNPIWAKRLPVLCDQKDAAATLYGLPVGDSADPKFYGGRASALPKLYTDDNADMDFWYKRSCCPPSTIWAQYVLTDELTDSNGILWRKLVSPVVEVLKVDGKLPRRFPKARKATAQHFPTEVYVREDWLHVLGSGKYEWQDIYCFYVFRSSSRHVVVVDRRCNVIVAEFAGGVPTK